MTRTKIWRLYEKADKEGALREAAQIIKNGGTVAFPTETVYGLGADGLSKEAVGRIFAAKGRPADNPLILHIADKQDLSGLVEKVPVQAEQLMEKFWPGPLTIIFKKQAHVSDAVTAALDTVAVRMPANEIARAFIRLCETPLAAPSANISGKPSPTEAAAVLADLNGKIEGLLDGGKTQLGLESTVVDCTGAVPALLRPGSITAEQLEELVAIKASGPLTGDKAPRAPGMKYHHYAPEAPLYVLDRGFPKDEIGVFCLDAMKKGLKVGCIADADTLDRLPEGTLSRGGWQDDKTPVLLAQNLYSWLRAFDEQRADLIIAQAVPATGLGAAIMNRLSKAAQEKTILTKEDLEKIFRTPAKDLC